jgi:hypothetical protein
LASEETIPRNPADLTPENRSLIHALHNLLRELELTATPARDEEAFAELKRIVHRRIEHLENDEGSVPPRELRGIVIPGNR